MPAPAGGAERLRLALRRTQGEADAEIEWLSGDGSNRTYARIRRRQGTFIAMVLAQPDPHRQAEEIGGGISGSTLPYEEIRQWLEAGGLPVPATFAYVREAGVLLIEDLGQTHLADCVAAAEPFAAHYESAIDELARFQALPRNDGVVFRRRYDRDLWQWELEHFLEFGVEVRGGITVRDRRELVRLFARLSDCITAVPFVPVHRDYHSRNLMIDQAGRLRWIDFQDALLGPGLYDVASLLYDAYVDLDDGLRAALLARYLAAADRLQVPTGRPPQALLRLLAIHRMLKAAGRFVFFDRRKGKPEYLRYIPGLLRRVRALAAPAGSDYPELAAIIEILRPLVPEWRDDG